MLNRTEEKIPAYLRLNGHCAEVEVEPNAIATAVIEEQNSIRNIAIVTV